jgi:hypothetical protein
MAIISLPLYFRHAAAIISLSPPAAAFAFRFRDIFADYY